MDLLSIADRLAVELNGLTFSDPAAYVYNPLEYARDPYARYVERYGGTPKESVFLGMNPGPWGMAQTGVPFGEIRHVRDWLGISGEVGTPLRQHPKRPVSGFSVSRSEASGKKLWGLIASRFGEPEAFFGRFFVLNYCPLLFFSAEGENLTPDRLCREEQKALAAACDDALRESVRVLGARRVIAVGGYAEKQAQRAVEGLAEVMRVPHPSPLNRTNRGDWEGAVLRELEREGVPFGCCRS